MCPVRSDSVFFFHQFSRFLLLSPFSPVPSFLASISPLLREVLKSLGCREEFNALQLCSVSSRIASQHFGNLASKPPHATPRRGRYRSKTGHPFSLVFPSVTFLPFPYVILPSARSLNQSLLASRLLSPPQHAHFLTHTDTQRTTNASPRLSCERPCCADRRSFLSLFLLVLPSAASPWPALQHAHGERRETGSGRSLSC